MFVCFPQNFQKMHSKLFWCQNRKSELSIDGLIISESLWSFGGRKRQNKFKKITKNCNLSAILNFRFLNRQGKFKRALSLRFWLIFGNFVLQLSQSKALKRVGYKQRINRKLWSPILVGKYFWLPFQKVFRKTDEWNFIFWNFKMLVQTSVRFCHFWPKVTNLLFYHKILNLHLF